MNHTRRNFLAAGSAFTVMAPHLVRGMQNNSALTVGLIGCGRRGTAISGIFARNEYAKVSALCDIYEDQLSQAAQKFSGAKHFKDYHELLASDVDAVYIAVPVWLHPQVFEDAVKAKKHIFMEKPAGVDPEGCRRVIEAGKRADPSKRITIDFQQRYGKDYRKAYEIVKSGEVGPVVEIRASWIGSGLPLRDGVKNDEEQMRNWLFYRQKSGDIIVEQDCHNLDVVNWFMGTHPVRASGYGSRMVRKSPGDILDNLGVTFHFENGIVFSYSASQISTSGYQDVSETFICENGAVNTSRRGYKVWRKGKPVEEASTTYDITQDAVNEFVDGARNGKLENASASAAESTLCAIMAREAIYTGKEVTFEHIASAKKVTL